MYGYYALVTVVPGVKQFGLLITPIQIVQFILCIAALVPESVDALAMGGVSCGATTRATVWMFFAYGVYLYLFVRMFGEKKAARHAERSNDKTK